MSRPKSGTSCENRRSPYSENFDSIDRTSVLSYSDINGFFNISFDECQRIWDIFIVECLKDEKEETARKKIMEAKLIGTVLTLAKLIKNSASPELISRWGNELERRIDIVSECF